MRLARLTVLLVLSAAALSAVAMVKQKTTITGRIVAFRPIDRIAQADSSARNEEIFLFEIENQKQGKNPTVVKIDYKHFAHSEISEQMLQGALSLKVKVKRSASCDQSYSELLSSVPKGWDEKSGMEIERGIAFVEMFKNIELAPELILKCYIVEKGDFQVLRDK
jgi:hypothetical protein